uniref:ribonuclease H n=1 Tax=Oncorhynchus mykiss TaxID=8022 RepID=A0A8L0DW93_ONCMY
MTVIESLTKMKSAGEGTPAVEVEERVMEHTAMISKLSAAMDRVVQNMDRWETQGVFPAPLPGQPGSTLNTPFPPEPSRIHLSIPQGYDGDAAGCQGFLLKLSMYLATVHLAPSDREKSFAPVSCLTRKALEWASAVCGGGDAALDDFEEFTRCFRTVFDHPPEGRAAGERLHHLRQEMRSAQKFALEFRTLAAGAGWSNRALIDHYRCSLREDLRRELVCRDTTLTFDQLVDLSIRLDNLLATRGRPDRGLVFPSSRTPSPIPMELRGAERRETGGGSLSCTICGRRGHTAGRCRVGSSGNRGSRQGNLASPQVSRHHSHPEPSVAHMFVSVTFSEFSLRSQHKVLVHMPFPVHAFDSRPLGSGFIREATAPLSMVTQGGHRENSIFLIYSPAYSVVLGLPWLACHNPTVSWPQRALTGWSRECSGRCLGVSVGATTVESPDQVSTVRIPPEYADLALAFCKKKATQLPPHRRGDCAIDLLVDAALPRSHVYPLSQAEMVAMETYISESLRQGYIQPSISPVSSSFFFVKKDGGLCPCIDYGGLNKITVRYTYPLPLIAMAIESMHRARFFNKLDLRSAYNLVRIRKGDERKTAFSTTSGHYEYLVMPYGLQPCVISRLPPRYRRCSDFLSLPTTTRGLSGAPNNEHAPVEWSLRH